MFLTIIFIIVFYTTILWNFQQQSGFRGDNHQLGARVFKAFSANSNPRKQACWRRHERRGLVRNACWHKVETAEMGERRGERTYSVSRERSQEDGVEALVQSSRPLLPQQRPQHVQQAAVLPICSYMHTPTRTLTIRFTANTCACPRILSHSPVWKLDFRTSGGSAIVQFRIPATPPATRMLGVLS